MGEWGTKGGHGDMVFGFCLSAMESVFGFMLPTLP